MGQEEPQEFTLTLSRYRRVVMDLHKLLLREFGVETSTDFNPLISQVSTSVLKVLDNNPNRVAWSFMNISVNNIYVAFDEQVSATHGFYLSALGGGMVLNWRNDMELPGFAVYAIATGINSDVYIAETVIIKGKSPE